MWTQAWTGCILILVVQFLTFRLKFGISLAKFIQKGGSYINYYMYHGGTNFGRTAGGPFIALAMTVMHLLMNMSYNEEAASHEENSFMMVGLLEQINNTRDGTIYLWYTTDMRTDSNKGFVSGGKLLVLAVLSASHAFHVFINKHLSECGPSFRSVECCRS